jgi:molecular chaperone Hsp33
MYMRIMEFQHPANSNEMLKNVSLPFMLESSGIRGRCVRLNEEVHTILTSNKYPASVAQLLGELLILVTMLGSLLKLKGMVSIQAQGDGAIGFISADYTDAGHLRGYAHLRDKKFMQGIDTKERGQQDITKLFGKGFLVITIETHEDTPYQAIVPLEGKSLTECIASYFRQSDQLDVAIEVAAKKVGKQWQAGGIVLQRIPSEGGKNKALQKEEDWNNATILLSSVTDAELIDDTLPLDSLLYRLFHADGVRIFDAHKLKAHCRCTRERMSNALKTLSPSEIENMKVKGIITMSCHFCNRREIFNDGDF